MSARDHAWLLRQDGPVTPMLMLKVVVVTAVLLAITYAVLRAYARRKGGCDQAHDRPRLVCNAALRLSAKTRVYLVHASSTEVLITESASGISVMLLPANATPGAPGP